MKYAISLIVEAEDIQAAFGRAYALIDKHGEGTPNGISEILVTEAAE